MNSEAFLKEKKKIKQLTSNQSNKQAIDREQALMMVDDSELSSGISSESDIDNLSSKKSRKSLNLNEINTQNTNKLAKKVLLTESKLNSLAYQDQTSPIKIKSSTLNEPSLDSRSSTINNDYDIENSDEIMDKSCETTLIQEDCSCSGACNCSTFSKEDDPKLLLGYLANVSILKNSIQIFNV